jgi:hypothetical protein
MLSHAFGGGENLQRFAIYSIMAQWSLEDKRGFRGFNGPIVLVMVFGSAILGMLIRRKLPEGHSSDETKSVVTLSMGVVGTLTALVLSLLIATASMILSERRKSLL